MSNDQKNKFGHPIKNAEKLSPVKVRSRVAFKRPLSAAERVARAIKDHEYLKSLDSRPGDDSFDSPEILNKSIHQLVTDPESGEEMTAGEYVMLQEERRQAHHDTTQFYEHQKQKVERQLDRKKLSKDKKKSDSDPDAED